MKRKPPREVMPGHYICCSDDKLREVEIVEHLGDGVFRFVFVDGRWIEYQPGMMASVWVKP